MDAPDRAAVVVAHPGHELMIHHFMERHRPLYFCLTDGSGGAAQPRMESTARLLQAVGATPGPICSRFTDREIYRLLLDHRTDVFVSLRDELAHSLADAGITCVVGDAMEGVNPVHDICRALIDSAATRVAAQSFEFSLDESPRAKPGALQLSLDGDALTRKLDAARAYPAMRREVEWALERFGVEQFANECLNPSSWSEMTDEFATARPRYETYGQLRVQEGRYHDVIRYREHVLPIFTALKQWTT
jgi:hypothetical protein